MTPPEKYLKKVIRRRPRDPDAWFKLGRFYFDEGMLLKAEKVFRKVLSLDRNHPQALSWLGAVLINCQPKMAVKLLRKALTLEPDEPSILHNLGVGLHNLKRYQEAEQILRKVLAIDQKRAESWHALGIVLDMMGKPEEGIAAVRKSLAIDSTDPMKWVTLGFIHERMERFEEAETIYRKAVKVDPYFPQAHKCLERVLRIQGKHDEALFAWLPDLGASLQGLSEEELKRWKEYIDMSEEVLDDFMFEYFTGERKTGKMFGEN
jgi:tetratricopeptide (TPR) repeat protein